MKLTRVDWFLAVGVFVVAVAGVAPDAVAADPPSTADVLMKLHQTNQKEMELGKMAEKHGGSKEVKEFGKMLVKDHGSADQQVMSLAKKEKIELGKHEMKAGEMPSMGKGAEFDAQFAKTMADDHTKDIAELTDARDRTKDDGLKTLLTGILPTLKKHQMEAEKILDKSKK